MGSIKIWKSNFMKLLFIINENVLKNYLSDMENDLFLLLVCNTSSALCYLEAFQNSVGNMKKIKTEIDCCLSNYHTMHKGT